MGCASDCFGCGVGRHPRFSIAKVDRLCVAESPSADFLAAYITYSALNSQLVPYHLGSTRCFGKRCHLHRVDVMAHQVDQDGLPGSVGPNKAEFYFVDAFLLLDRR